MSMADDLFDYMYERWLNEELEDTDMPVPGPPYIWMTESGKEILLEEMTSSHIKNCMEKLDESYQWYHIFKDELERRRKLLDSLGMKGTEL